MKSLNRVFLMGHLGADPQIKVSKTGKSYARLSVATNRSWMNAEDHREEKTDWHSVFVWGPLADRCCHNLRKGALVFVEGSLSYWKVAEGEIGKDGYKNAIHGQEVKFLNYPKATDSASNEAMNAFEDAENLDNPSPPLNHNAVAHPA
ncbi:MAG: single-stranded DNA-binding protein [Bdellovibrionales bacterium]